MRSATQAERTKMQRDSLIELVLLKTKSQPEDAYAEFFLTARGKTASPSSISEKLDEITEFRFRPIFVPVLEHKQDEGALSKLGYLLRMGQLKEIYGGMIFTSQRAVEAWSDIVSTVEREAAATLRSTVGAAHSQDASPFTKDTLSQQEAGISVDRDQAVDERSNQPFTTDIYSLTEFPLYTVGPATSRALDTLVTTTRAGSRSATCSREDTDADSKPISPFLSLNPTVLGAHAGNGANLAEYMLQHYNALQAQKWFTFYEAPRLPFIPIVGMGSENYSRKRLDATDPRLTKKPLLFLVGEQRRDIIPKTLMDHDKLGVAKAITVEELEVYSTVVRDGFRKDFDDLVRGWTTASAPVPPLTQATQRPSLQSKMIIIVVFSPQGTRDLLRSTGLLTDQGTLNHTRLKSRWYGTTHLHTQPSSSPSPPPPPSPPPEPYYIIATIGPTTRDFLRSTYGLEADICAPKPSPQGLWDGIQQFLRETRAG